MRPKDPTSEPVRQARIVVGVDGSGCGTRAFEFAPREAARWDALLHVLPVHQETPAAGGLVEPVRLAHESAEATVFGSSRPCRGARADGRRQGRDSARPPRAGSRATGHSSRCARRRHAWLPRADWPPLGLRVRACSASRDLQHDRRALKVIMFWPCDTQPSHLFPRSPLRLAEMCEAGGDENPSAVGDLLATYARQQETQEAQRGPSSSSGVYLPTRQPARLNGL